MRRRLIFFAILMTLLLSGCSSPAVSSVQSPTPANTPTPMPTNTSAPTNTPVPTNTPAAPATTAPTNTPATCADQANLFLKEGQRLYDQWRDTAELAAHTSRIALSPVVTQLQDLRRQWRALPAPPCAKPAQTAVEKYMDSVVTGYLGFMSESATGSLEIELAKVDLLSAWAEYGEAFLPAPFDIKETRLDLGN